MKPEERHMRNLVAQGRRQRRQAKKARSLALLGRPADAIDAALWDLRRAVRP